MLYDTSQVCLALGFDSISYVFVLVIDAQIIKIDNGIGFSKMLSNEYNVFTSNAASYNVSIGVEYLNRKYFQMSSELGYLCMGGKDNILIKDDTGCYIETLNLREDWNFISFNTTFRVKHPLDRHFIYLGVGPFVDVLVGSNEFSLAYPGFKANRVMVGVCPEIGVNYYINDKFYLGLNCSYSYSFIPIVEGLFNYNLYNQLFACALSFGYKIK